MAMNNNIVIKGAREHNLKNIDVTIPRDKLVVITGLSGSGKSSLAFDTMYAEGQRRYVESLSAYARQFLGQMDKPDVDSIDGLSPAISIDQKTTSKNPRSTVGTVTEIYDYLRLLYARVGVPHCPECGKEIEHQTIDGIVDKILALPERTKMNILAPVIRGKKGEYVKKSDYSPSEIMHSSVSDKGISSVALALHGNTKDSLVTVFNKKFDSVFSLEYNSEIYSVCSSQKFIANILSDTIEIFDEKGNKTGSIAIDEKCADAAFSGRYLYILTVSGIYCFDAYGEYDLTAVKEENVTGEFIIKEETTALSEEASTEDDSLVADDASEEASEEEEISIDESTQAPTQPPMYG